MPKLLSKAFMFACLIFSGLAYAAEVGTPDEAKAMAIHAADFLRQNGADKAFPVFNAKDGNSMIATSTSWSTTPAERLPRILP
jgi:hypothetical protein